MTDFKKKAGSLLIKLKQRDFSLSLDEISVAKFLVDKGLAKHVGQTSFPQRIDVGDVRSHYQQSMLAYYELTGLGEEFVQRHPEDRLCAGRFLFPGEAPWYDRWPWKLVLPGLVSLVISIIVTVIAFFFHK